jgi:hypothetical protein
MEDRLLGPDGTPPRLVPNNDIVLTSAGVSHLAGPVSRIGLRGKERAMKASAVVFAEPKRIEIR